MSVNADTMKLHTTHTTLRRTIAVALLLALLTPSLFVRADLPDERIDKEAFVDFIAELAIAERIRSGVPASITAAQAILESNWGRGHLAVKGNNYFGIKCKRGWIGPTVYHKDDDLDANGKLRASCFRAYDDVADSFRDHSDFLTGRERYADLFYYHPEDYRAWAHGLRSCGYATDPAYGDKLVALIERLQLYVLDWPGNHYEQRMAKNSTEPKGFIPYTTGDGRYTTATGTVIAPARP